MTSFYYRQNMSKTEVLFLLQSKKKSQSCIFDSIYLRRQFIISTGVWMSIRPVCKNNLFITVLLSEDKIGRAHV